MPSLVLSARRAPARRRWRGSSRTRPAPSSRSCRPSRPRSGTSARCSRGPASASGRAGGARSSSSTRSTASTRPSRTRCCPGSRRGCHADRRDDREPVLRAQLGAALADAALRARAAREEQLAEVVRRGAADARRRARARGSRQLIAQRAGGDARTALGILELAVADGARGGEPVGEEHVEDAARKRPLVYDKARRRALRLHLGVDQVDARERRAGVGLLPRGDARERRGRALHRAADDRARLRGHRQRRPAGAAGRRRGGAGRRARRPARRRGSTSPRRPSTWRARRSRTRPTARSATATARVRERGHLRPPDALRSAAYPGARKLGRGEGYVYPHDDPAGFEVDCLPDELKGTVFYRPSGDGEETDRPRRGAGCRSPKVARRASRAQTVTVAW